MKIILLYLFLSAICIKGNKYSCKDVNGRNVDFFVIHKYPELKKLPDELIFQYYDDNSQSTFTTFSNITAPNMPLETTLQQFLGRNYAQEYVYINYGQKDESFAHSKLCFLHFVDEQGYVLLHSLPQFLIDRIYKFPKNAKEKGQQHIICLTIDKNGLNLFADLIYTIAPKMQLTEISNGFLNSFFC